jgi:hypothetical protein
MGEKSANDLGDLSPHITSIRAKIRAKICELFAKNFQHFDGNLV